MQPKLLCSNPIAQYTSYRNEILEAIQSVCDSGHYVLGPEVQAFEKEFAAYNNVKHAIGVGSGTDALVLSLKALGIGSGDEVITVSHTALATVAAIASTGATPVLVDIEEQYFTIDPVKVEEAITSKTKAIIPVHLYGQPCDMDALMRIAKDHGLKVVEDCAQAHGALYKGKKVGSIGDLGCFSFYPTKNLGSIGDGGGIIANNEALASKIVKLRQYGWDTNRVSQHTSTVSRLDELQAAILRIKLRYLDADNSKRRAIAMSYNESLQGIGLRLPVERDNCEMVYHLYVIKTQDRDALKNKLEVKGVQAGIHYTYPVHSHPSYKDCIKIAPGGLKVTDKAVQEILSLPMYPELDIREALKIIKEVINV